MFESFALSRRTDADPVVVRPTTLERSRMALPLGAEVGPGRSHCPYLATDAVDLESRECTNASESTET